MGMEIRLEQMQKIALTQTMQQSLNCLQMPAVELSAYLEEAALSNPMLELTEPPIGFTESAASEGTNQDEVLPIQRREQVIPRSISDQDGAYFCASRPTTFAEHLNNQLGQMRQLDEATLARCQYLVGCLNSSGYLDCSLEELAAETGQKLFDMEQALFIVQSLDPVGVGARSLSECLLLQLVEGKAFTEVNIHLVQSGLPLLAQGDIRSLAQLLGVSQQEVHQAADVVRSLNPVPSRGFYTPGTVPYTVPEATILFQNGQVIIKFSHDLLPKVSVSSDYSAILKQTDDPEIRAYLHTKCNEAKALITCLEKREDTLYQLLSAVVQFQRDFFLNGSDLLPMTMGQIAQQLGVNISTVSRAVKDKYIQFNGRVLPLRSLFSAALPSGTAEQGVSPDMARAQLQRFIGAEPHDAPLCDEALRCALCSVGLNISRRTVAKYRSELGIPSAGGRKRRYASQETNT